MAKCNACGKEGLFLSVDKKTGLCSDCGQAFVKSYDRTHQIINESLETAQKSKNLKIALRPCDVLIEKAQHLSGRKLPHRLVLFQGARSVEEEMNNAIEIAKADKWEGPDGNLGLTEDILKQGRHLFRREWKKITPYE